MISQTLVIVPHGVIESGSVSIQADPSTGLVQFQETMTVGVWPFEKTIQDQEAIKVQPDLLRSENIKPGLRLSIWGVAIEVEATNGKVAECAVEFVNGNDTAKGTAEIDLSGEHVKIQHIIMSGTIQGIGVTIELQG